MITPELVIQKLQQPGCPESLTPQNLDKLFLAILPVFHNSIDKKVKYIVSKTSDNTATLSYRSNVVKAEERLKKALSIYLFTTKRWQDKIPLIPYLLKALNNFCIEESATINQKINKFICPACREFFLREPLVEMSNGVLFCKSCSDFLKQNNFSNEYRKNLSTLFKLHSKKGAKCPKCNRFVPYSLKNDGKLLCPYKNCQTDCINELKGSHPICAFSLDMVSIDATIYPNKENCNKSVSLEGVLGDKKIKAADVSIEQKDQINNMYSVISDIINIQKNINGKTRNSPNKQIMYDSILNVLEKHPVEMINFLIKKNHCFDLPMQPLIFQEFSKNMIDVLPIEYCCNCKTIKIEDPIDSNLKLFTGICSFENQIDKNLILRKPTTLLKYKESDYSKEDVVSKYSFIGYIRSILDEAGNDLSDFIDVYSFVNIKFLPHENIFAGKKVCVEYFSIPAHYSMLSMAHLRRIVKKIHLSCVKKI